MLSYIVQYQPTKFVHAHLSILDSDDHWNSPNTMNITLPNISIGKRYVQHFLHSMCPMFDDSEENRLCYSLGTYLLY